MVNNNNLINLANNKKPVELVQELKDYEIKKSPLSPAARAKVIKRNGSDYVSDNKEGYGPCRNTLCGCFCSKDECDCKNPEFSVYKDYDKKILNGTASGGIGLGGHSISGDADLALFRRTQRNSDLKVGNVSVGAYAIDGGLGCGVRASANAFSLKEGGAEIRVGPSLDTGGRISDNGVELKFLGAGVSIGKKMEISTPVGSVACIVQ